MYAFSIDVESSFSALVAEEEVDTVLYLFDAEGVGLWGSDDVEDEAYASAISVSLAAGDYFVGVSSYDNMPTSDGIDMFEFDADDQVPAVGSGAISGWGSEVGGEIGDYSMQVSVTPTVVPEPSGACIALLASVGLVFLRRRDETRCSVARRSLS